MKYGETSVIVTIFTERFGVKSYLVNGVRVSTKKGTGKANLFQPTAILDLVVYNNELKQLQRIREFKWGYLYQQILSDVRKNAVALFIIELITKCLKQPEENPELFSFCEDVLIHLDKSSDAVMANMPLFFSLHLPVFFGFRMSINPLLENREISNELFLDLEEGEFVAERPRHSHFLEGKEASITAQLLKVQQPDELADIRLNHDTRRQLLLVYERYYALHIQDFGTMKSLPVLRELLS